MNPSCQMYDSEAMPQLYLSSMHAHASGHMKAWPFLFCNFDMIDIDAVCSDVKLQWSAGRLEEDGEQGIGGFRRQSSKRRLYLLLATSTYTPERWASSVKRRQIPGACRGGASGAHTCTQHRGAQDVAAMAMATVPHRFQNGQERNG